MAAHVALTALGLITALLPQRPLLVEVARYEVAATIRTLTVASAGSWYLTDPEQHLIVWRRADGTTGGTVGGYGWGLSALDDPSGAATDGNRVYVADRGNHRIVSYDRSLRPLGSFSTRDTNDARARFGYPGGVAVSGRGDLIVLDGESNEVVGFRPDRRVAFRLGRQVPGGPPLAAPMCVHVDDTERLLVGEPGGVRIFDLFGNQTGRVQLGERSDVRAVAASGGWLAAISPDTLYLSHVSESVVHRWYRGSLAADTRSGELRSVAWSDGDLLVMISGAVIRFRVDRS